MYNPKTGVIVLGSNRNKNTICVVREMKTEIKIDCSSRIIKDKIRRENKPREQDTRGGFWRYN